MKYSEERSDNSLRESFRSRTITLLTVNKEWWDNMKRKQQFNSMKTIDKCTFKHLTKVHLFIYFVYLNKMQSLNDWNLSNSFIKMVQFWTECLNIFAIAKLKKNDIDLDNKINIHNDEVEVDLILFV